MARGKLFSKFKPVAKCYYKNSECSGELSYFKDSFSDNGVTLCQFHLEEIVAIDKQLVKATNNTKQ